MDAMQNIKQGERQCGLRILSLDDGGVRGLSELIILREIMFRLMHLENSKSLPKPCDYFDIIGGAGTGGVIALMLGRLRMPIDLAIDKYVNFNRDIYSNVKKWSRRTEKFKAAVFESGMRDIIRSAGYPEDVSMQEDNPLCRSFVVALPSVNMTPQVFRTYEVRANQGYDSTVVQAARATTATPDVFKPVSITSGGVLETFVGASLGYSNPTNLALKEAAMVFGPFQSVACLVSIGAGHPGHVSWESSKPFGHSLTKNLYQIVTNCETLAESHQEYYMQFPGVFYRLSIDQGLQNIALDDWNKQGEIKTHSLAYLHKAEVIQKLNGLTNSLSVHPQTTTLEVLSRHTSMCLSDKQTSTSKLMQALLPVIPAPFSLFIGRIDILSKLERYFNACQSSLDAQVQRCFVLYGLGGAGKTQIALQFYHKYRQRFSIVLMIDASSQTSIEQFLVSLAQSAQLTDTTSTAALTWLYHQKEEWLMIFDNADDSDMNLHDFFPVCSHGNIIITSRNEASKIYAPENNCRIGELTVEDSLAVFYKTSQRAISEQAAVCELVNELGYLALAIVQTGSYLFHNQHLEVKQYLENYKKNKSRYLVQVRKQKMDSYQFSVFATWDLSYKKLDERAKKILMLCSVLHNCKIPLSILAMSWKNLANTSGLDTQELKDFLEMFVTERKNWNDQLVEEAVDRLRSYSLVEITGTGAIVLNIHSLVHTWAFKSLSRKKQMYAQRYAQQIFFCLANTRIEYIDASQWVLHIQSLLNQLNHECYNSQVAKALHRIFSAAHFWTDAEQLQQQILTVYTKKFGSSHLKTLKAMSDLAQSFKKGKKLNKAEQLDQKVVIICTEAFGSNHSVTFDAMSRLAESFTLVGKLKQAEQLQQQVLKGFTEKFGNNHSKSLQAMSNLAIIFTQARKLEEAKQLNQQVLKACIEAFGSSHLMTIEAMFQLAKTLKHCDRPKEAEQFDQKVLNACLEAFGSSHLMTVEAMSQLAKTLRLNGRPKEAEQLDQKVLIACIKTFGSRHPRTFHAMSNFAATSRMIKKIQEAEQLDQQVLNACIEAFGCSHPETVQAMFNLFRTFIKGGKIKEAEQLGQKLLKTYIDIFGSSYVGSFQAMSYFAIIFTQSGKLEEAKKLAENVLLAWIEAFGSNNPLTIEAMSNLVVILRKDKKLKEAIKLQQKVCYACIETFGKNHPRSTQAINIAIQLEILQSQQLLLECIKKLKHWLLRSK